MTTSPFLNSSPILLRRWLGMGLFNLRQQAGVGQGEAAARLDVRRQTIGHYESGRNLPSVGDLEALLDMYGASEEIEHYRALRDGARRGENWWQKVSQIPSWFDHYLGLESGAVRVDAFAPMFLPGLLQTENYARAIFSADSTYAENSTKQLVNLRLRRRHIFEREFRPAHLRVIVDESVLYRRQGSAEVMHEQLLSLLDDMEHPQIELRVLPLSVGAFEGQLDYPFKVLSFPEEMIGDHGVVFVELLGDARYYEEEGEIELYEQAMERLSAVSASLSDSRKLVQRAVKEFAE
ncbi:helix-turn-helix domain-containing protein [Actinopolyspora saharensis]|uniref:Helix-turn-helix domain-containing protein n=1 Tax=Actinopolyspora saharensis TaxID=995062 RepID=A0A1H1ECH3_9ACTN|nr:helix-turn-helix transcriptional regulator [Actinopolyspora saharensis]SDQ86228.1 Helix-turn-helix domain-containing protein [Actinopolyspora saharensis]